MPVVEHKRLLPESDRYPFMALDEDGYDLPSDWLVPIPVPFPRACIQFKLCLLFMVPHQVHADLWIRCRGTSERTPDTRDIPIKGIAGLLVVASEI